jgi:hypothetical protein
MGSPHKSEVRIRETRDIDVRFIRQCGLSIPEVARANALNWQYIPMASGNIIRECASRVRKSGAIETYVASSQERRFTWVNVSVNDGFA